MKSVTLSIVNDTGNIKSVMFDGVIENIKNELVGYYNTKDLAEKFINANLSLDWDNIRYFDNITNFKQDHWTFWYGVANYIFMNDSWYEVIANNYDDVQFINITQN